MIDALKESWILGWWSTHIFHI